MHIHTLLVWLALGRNVAPLGWAVATAAKAATVRVERMNFMVLDFFEVLICVMFVRIRRGVRGLEWACINGSQARVELPKRAAAVGLW